MFTSCLLFSLYGHWLSLSSGRRTVPSAAPIDVRAAALDSWSIKVTWNPPPVERHNGRLTHYVIKYQKVPDVKSAPITSSTASTHHKSTSPSSSLLPSSSSLLPSPVVVPKSPSVKEVAVVSPNPAEDHNEVDEDYESENSSPRIREVVAPDATSRSYVIQGLEEWTSYRISVSAATIIGSGPSSPDLVVRTDEFGRRLVLMFLCLHAFCPAFCSSPHRYYVSLFSFPSGTTFSSDVRSLSLLIAGISVIFFLLWETKG